MLRDLFPKAWRRYSSLPLLGSSLVEFAPWLIEKGYTRSSSRQKLMAAARVDRHLRRRGLRGVSEIAREHLEACWRRYCQRAPNVAATARVLGRFLQERGLLPPRASEPQTPSGAQADAYAAHLREIRGMGELATRCHVLTVRKFLQHIDYDRDPSRLAGIQPTDIEDFVKVRGKGITRGYLQHIVAHMRGFLRFLAISGKLRPGLDAQIDTPRLYRLEKLPRALPWETVRALLRSIDRTTAIGLRDYAIFTLVATYGLRASEVVALTLQDIHWREGWLRIPPRKNGTSFHLPLTDSVGAALLDYLRRGKPASQRRELFLRARAPAGVLKPTAVTEAFQAWSRRSGLKIPYQGPHCLRHSLAVHLLREGTSLKTIGDLLGHRTAESTCVYLRLDVEDLRGVALCVPSEDSVTTGEEEF
jgi:integrase/recombinase XerD